MFTYISALVAAAACRHAFCSFTRSYSRVVPCYFVSEGRGMVLVTYASILAALQLVCTDDYVLCVPDLEIFLECTAS